jgi:hypothetical protein
MKQLNRLTPSVYKPKVGDILFYDTFTFFGKIVKFFTGYKYSHVAVVYNSEGEVLEIVAGKESCLVPISLDKSFHIEVRRSRQEINQSDCVKLIDENIGKGYDYFAIIRILIKRLTSKDLNLFKNDSKRIFCSEFVDYLYSELGVDLVPKNKDSVVNIQDVRESAELDFVTILQK